MKASLRPGVSKVKRVVVDRARTVGFMGEGGRVYSTPQLLCDIEETCRDLLLDHSDAGEDSVGMDVTLRHLAPTLMDMAVDITVTVTAVEGRKVVFEVSASDPIEPICAATHTRFVVDVGKTVQRLQAKAAKHAAAANA